jgi:hypothetical protein
MSTYLFALFVTIWDWVLAPPLNWLLSLSLEWQIELGALVVFVFFCVPIIEYTFIGRDLSGEWWTERRRRSEWYFIGSMEPREFRGYVASIRRKADKKVRLAERLESRVGNGFKSYVLRQAAWRRQLQAQALQDEADRLEQLWKAIEKQREQAGDGAMGPSKVLRLMRRLDSVDDRVAHGAFAELRRIGNSFNWESLAPRDMAPQHRERLVKYLRLMAGTPSLDEGRNAYHSALRMLEENGWSRQWEAA